MEAAEELQVEVDEPQITLSYEASRIICEICLRALARNAEATEV